MEDLLKETNETTNTTMEGRKKEAKDLILSGVALAGIAACTIRGEERLKVIDAMMRSTIKVLENSGFAVKGKEVEFEAKFKFILILTAHSASVQAMEEASGKVFDESMWDKCVFDAKEQK